MLSDRQHDAYRFIVHYIQRHGKAPLLSEIAAGLGIRSKGVVHRYLQALADEGVITLEAGRHRGIRLNEEGSTALPLLGRIAAGRPIEALPGEEQLDLSTFFMGANRFVLKVAGDSMEEAGILDGDMVVVESRSRAENGEIIVALIDGAEATLKRLQDNRDGTITLIPANRALQPLRYPAERITIQGVVVAQLRSYR